MFDHEAADLSDYEQAVVEVYDQELDQPKLWSQLERGEKLKRAGTYAASTLAVGGGYYLGLKIGFISPNSLQP